MGQVDAGQAKDKMTRGRKVLLGVGCGLAAVAAGLLAVCWFVGIRSMADVASYRAMRREGFHPVWKDLAWRRFERGSELESLMRKYEALQREEAGVYTRLVYGAGDEHGRVTVVAKDGRLTAAVADTRVGRHVFFYDLEQMQDFGQAHKEYTQQKRAEMDVMCIDRAMREGRDIFLGRCLLCDGKPYYDSAIRILCISPLPFFFGWHRTLRYALDNIGIAFPVGSMNRDAFAIVSTPTYSPHRRPAPK